MIDALFWPYTSASGLLAGLILYSLKVWLNGGGHQVNVAMDDVSVRTSSAKRILAEEREQTKAEAQKRQIIIGVVFVFLLVAYVAYTVDNAHSQSAEEASKALETKILEFPKGPMEYNLRQRIWFISSSWRRFNIRNISIFCGSLVITIALMTWHRRRRVFLQRRKTIFFWAWTVTAMVAGFAWSFYMMRKQKGAKTQLQRLVHGDPFLRFATTLGGILVLSMVLYIWRLKHFRKKLTRKEKLVKLNQAAKEANM